MTPAATVKVRRWGGQKVAAAEGLAPTLLPPSAGCATPASATVKPVHSPGLTAQQLDTFVTHGYVSFRPRVPPGTHEAIVKAADAAYEVAGHTGRQNSTPVGNNILADVPELQAVFGCPDVRAALCSVVGEHYVVHPHKRPHQNDPGSAAQTIHKDSHAGFEVHRAHMPWIVMAMYYPRSVVPGGAPTSLCPGTQFYSGDDRFDARHLERDVADETLQRWGSDEQHFTCEAGTVVLVHNDLWHRGTANQSDRRRWMFCFMFMRALPPTPALRPAGSTAYSDLEQRRSRQAICMSVRGWLDGLAAPADADVEVRQVEEELLAAQDDQPRLQAAYALALADSNAVPGDAGGTDDDDVAAASSVLAHWLEAGAEPLRRAAKFGAVAACHRQLLLGRTEMVERLLEVLEGAEDPGAASCAARALFEHGAWAAARPPLRARAADVLARAAEPRGQRRTVRQDAETSSPAEVPTQTQRPPGAGALRGRVKTWKEAQGYGFITPMSGASGEDVFVASTAFGGGELLAGRDVWYDVKLDPRTGKRSAIRVAGEAVSHNGGRRVGCRNLRLCALEALAVLPQSAEDPTAAVAASTFARVLSISPERAQRMVGSPGAQEDGEAVMAAALGSLRLVTRTGASGGAAWWPMLRKGLVGLVEAVAATQQQGEARMPGAGGKPGADNGLRYALGYSLDALWRSGDENALMQAVEALPGIVASLRAGQSVEQALTLRRCHLTTKDHTF